MLDNKVKEILQEQFSKEKNYQKVMLNVDKKYNKTKYIKIIKYALLPTCAVLLAAIIIPKMNNKNNEFYKNIAHANTVIEQTQINNENEIPENKNTTTPIEVAKDKIYKTIEGEEACWVYDPTIPENIIKDNQKSTYIVKVKITSIGEGEMIPKQENFYNPFTCYTPIKMQVIDNLLETNKLSGTITTYINGGKIKIANILKGTKQQIEYMGIGDVSQVDSEQYIEYKWSTPYYEPIIGEEYVIIIGKANENLYQISCGGYGIFKVEKIENQERYINVITNKEWKIE